MQQIYASSLITQFSPWVEAQARALHPPTLVEQVFQIPITLHSVLDSLQCYGEPIHTWKLVVPPKVRAWLWRVQLAGIATRDFFCV